ncbi:MAG TPA: bifunctional 4-hydroxy-2-oxoglutarate aldolase/2-dehydro-3-deoxy-phosphogluconate aldolase [Anaerolineae bacterium]
MPETILETLGDLGLVPVVKIDRAENAVPLAQALIDGGLPCAEITFRTAAAEEAIRRIASALPQAVVGAGTVLSVDQAEKAVSAGAQFIVSPGFDPKVVDWCLAKSAPVIPGVATPTEINMALDKGLRILKFFPAEAFGGIHTLKAIAAAYGNVRFIPTGGIDLKNLAEYLSLPSVYACGGSWLVTSQLVSSGQYAEISRLAQEARAIVRQVRGEAPQHSWA